MSGLMHKFWKYPRDMIQCSRSSYCIDNLFITYLFPKKTSTFKCNYVGTFGFFCSIFSNVISLVLMDSDTDSENVSSIVLEHSVLNGQKTSNSKGVSWIGL